VERAIRRLSVLEVVIAAAAVVVAVAGGAVVAFVLSAGTAIPFGPTWGITSILLIVVPTALFFAKDRLRRRSRGGESHDP
jgi:hypothetical protein